ncbi:MAG: peptidoglycan synthetase [Sphingobacteriales bacterium]|nr:peptidoglycan synthetase [Sphingobacteriales bacterium]
MRVHFIAIGGSTMHNLAIALSKKGYQVTGSDDIVFEPSKSRLLKYNLLPAFEGWDVNNINPDLDAVILGMHARLDNPELLKAQELGLKIYSYPEYIYEQSKNKLRVVIGGSHGKTTITSMILHVLNFYNKEFDYLVGAQLEGFETMVKVTQEAPTIIIEGDEYLASPIDRRPKFHLYKANIGIISGIAWDHINVFPTYESYVDQFRIFLETIEPNGTIIYSEEDPEVKSVVESFHGAIKKLPYSTPKHSITNGITQLDTDEGCFDLLVFGNHNLLNLNVARIACNQLNISNLHFYKAIQSFSGAARRLELLGKNDDLAIYKDFAHSPSKLKATVEAVKNQFPDRKLVAVMELHTFSSLNKNFLSEYSGSMDDADEAIVFIDKKTFSQKGMEPYSDLDVIQAFGNEKVKFFNNPEILKQFLSYLNYKRKNLLLMSSGNFGNINLVELTGEILLKAQ